jgi:hypothetical protein
MSIAAGSLRSAVLSASGTSQSAATWWRKALAPLIGVMAALILAGCAAAPPARRPLPPDLAAVATVAGIEDARYWADRPPASFNDWLHLSEEGLRDRFSGIMDRPHAYLLLSGGGGDGAFGAGLLVGWSANGTRPEFQIVTGISTGALIAPFAFLGAAYDSRLRELYTRLATKDLVTPRPIMQLLTGDSAFDTAPLRKLLQRYIGDAEVAAIAAEGRRGRSLLIGTTNLDSARGVIWDLTKIAASGAPGAAQTIRDIVLASASIPGAFPPVLLDVQANGRHYDEMHVDGGVTSQVFLGPEGLDWSQVAEHLHVQGPPQIYIIRNSRLVEQWDAVEPRLGPIVSRTISSLIRTQGIGDLARIYIAAEHSGLGFNLARVPSDFSKRPSEMFDPAYMRELFERGFALARNGYPWVHGSEQ